MNINTCPKKCIGKSDTFKKKNTCSYCRYIYEHLRNYKYMCQQFYTHVHYTGNLDIHQLSGCSMILDIKVKDEVIVVFTTVELRQAICVIGSATRRPRKFKP